ncbi:MAG: amidohydrolase family protein, partial [Candidatus Limnocylindria bacterium]
MARPKAELIVSGQVVTSITGGEVRVVEAIGIADGRVVSHGSADDVRRAAAPNARTIAAAGRAVIPGLHDAHLHLVDLARSLRTVDLTPARDLGELLALASRELAALRPGAWLSGRGWSADSLPDRGAERLNEMVDDHLGFLRSRDGHSAWASPAVLARAHIGAATDDPTGGRIERGPHGEPTGIVRETAVDLVTPFVDRLGGEELWRAMDETLTA